MPHWAVAQKSTSLHVRVHDSLLQQIDAYAASAGATNRSEVIRLCIHAVLGDDLQRAAVEQVIYQSDDLKRIVIGKLITRMTAQMPQMLKAVLEEIADEQAATAAQ